MKSKGIGLGVAVLVLAGCRVDSTPERLVLFQEGDLYGYKTASGGVAIAPKYHVAEEFSERGVAMVVDAEGWSCIDTRGEVLVRPFVFDNGPDYFQEGLARFVREGKFGFFDEDCKVVIEAKFDFARPFSDGKAAVCEGCREEGDGEHKMMVGGRWGYINRQGEVVVPLTEPAPSN